MRMTKLVPSKQFVIVLAATALAGLSFMPLAGGFSGLSEPSKPKCKKGYYWSSSRRKCVRRRNRNLSDQDRYLAGRNLTLNGRHREALEILHGVKNTNHAGVLTYIGYATRKLGDVDQGISYYHKALAIEPRNVATREYLGEGYVSRGDFEMARQQLQIIAQLAGTDSHEYKELAAALSGHNAPRNR